jgi:outer membrane biosynthesis protein TonB
MFKTLRDKMTLSGTTVLMIGVALLIFTFVSAYAFLTQSLSIVTSGDLAQTFGEALAPLIATSVHIMYLGVMGWVSSILTIRGVTILSQARQTNVAPEELLTTAKEKTQTKTKEKEPEKAKEPEVKPPETKPKETKPEEPKPKETKPYEPEIIVLAPEPLPQKQQQVIPQEKKENH